MGEAIEEVKNKGSLSPINKMMFSHLGAMKRFGKIKKSIDSGGINFMSLVNDLKKEAERIEFEKEEDNFYAQDAEKIFKDIETNYELVNGR